MVDCANYQRLSLKARALLIELARQYTGGNNGRLLASRAYMAKRGWNSSDTLTRAKNELLEGGFIFETVKGCRPNKASWYALTWLSLDKDARFDPGVANVFERGAYRLGTPIAIALPKPIKTFDRGAVQQSPLQHRVTVQ